MTAFYIYTPESMLYRLKLISHKYMNQPNCLTRELKSNIFGNSFFAPSGFMFAAQHGIGENIFVFCLTEPNNSDVRNYYICFPFGEIVCANAARMKKNGVTTATILSGYISVSLPFFKICNCRTYGYSLSKLWFFICILTIFRVHIP